jgi:hypothetical protein
MALLILIALQLVGTAAAIGVLWRRGERQRRELEDLRAQLDALSAQRIVQRPRREAVALATVAKAHAEPTLVATRQLPMAPGTPAWRLPDEVTRAFAALPVSASTLRNFTLTLAALAPALGFAAHIGVVTMVGAGVVIGAAMMLVSLMPHWRQAAWGGAFTGFCRSPAPRVSPKPICGALPMARLSRWRPALAWRCSCAQQRSRSAVKSA